MPEYEPETLRASWQALCEQNPKLRIRDAADRIGVSEAQLVALGAGETATRLRGPWADLLLELYRLGPLLGLTRNDHAVHERHGAYCNLKLLGDVRIVEDEGFEVALFLAQWRHGFAVSEASHGQIRHSLQFFAEDGHAVHKIYLTEQSRSGLFWDLVAQFRSAEQSDRLQVKPRQPHGVANDADRLWSSQLVSGWPRSSEGTPLTTPDLTNRSASVNAERLKDGAAEAALSRAVALGTPLVIAVGNEGAMQLHRGPIHKIMRTGPWINVLDEPFNLHLRDTQLASGWCVRELTPAGAVSLCWCDRQHRPILQIFSEDRSGTWEECVHAATLCPKAEAGA